eukprot:4744682-Lingulodinium_polyedra.AAC.1
MVDPTDQLAMDQLIAKLRTKAREQEVPSRRLEIAVETVAQAGCKLERATSHLEGAQAAFRKAQ